MMSALCTPASRPPPTTIAATTDLVGTSEDGASVRGATPNVWATATAAEAATAVMIVCRGATAVGRQRVAEAGRVG